MKKARILFLTLLAFVMGAVVLAACGKESLPGVYKLYSIIDVPYGGKEYRVGEDLRGVIVSEDYMTLELKEDGSLVLTQRGEVFIGTWKQREDGNLDIADKDGDVKSQFQVEDGKIIYPNGTDGMTFCLAK